jgi:translocation and assembly module TamB
VALGQVTGLVEGLAGEGVGLDVIEIRPDGLRGATLIAGRYISPKVYVGFKQPIGRDQDDPDGRSGFERTEVELEYQALRWLLLNMEASNSAVSFLLRYRRVY